MAHSEEVFDEFIPAIATRRGESPWDVGPEHRRYLPDLELLAELLGIPITGGHGQASGRLAKAIDAWCSSELRRAGFDADEVWPRLERPRVLPNDIAELIAGLPKAARDQVIEQVLKNRKVAPAEARVLGRVFVKQADVLIARWSRGAELLISTKSMLSSFGNNLRNRFEESYGDAKNLRGRFPLVSLGFLYILRSTILNEPDNWELALDMLRKLREDHDGYDATGLIVAEWDDDNFAGVTLLEGAIPEDLRADQLLSTVIGRVLERTPVQFHVKARELRDAREVPIEEGVEPGADEGDGDD